MFTEWKFISGILSHEQLDRVKTLFNKQKQNYDFGRYLVNQPQILQITPLYNVNMSFGWTDERADIP